MDHTERMNSEDERLECATPSPDEKLEDVNEKFVMKFFCSNVINYFLHISEIQ